MNTRIGAFAFDITQSHAEVDELGTLSGQSYRLTYSKMVEATNTSFNVAAYRFSTEDYLSLNDAASLRIALSGRNMKTRLTSLAPNSIPITSALKIRYRSVLTSRYSPATLLTDRYTSAGPGRITGMATALPPITASATTTVLLTAVTACRYNVPTIKTEPKMTASI